MDNDDLLALLARCERAVDDLQRMYEWELLKRETFVTRTMEVVRARIIPEADRAAWYVYSEVLYEACSGREGRALQEQGYWELYRCLYRRVIHRYPDVEAWDVAQQTVLVIHDRFAECREPHAFLAFAFQCLWSEVRRIRRRRSHELPPLNDETTFPEPRDQGPEPAEELVQRDQIKEWDRFLQEAKLIMPRAAQQLEIVRLTYVLGFQDSRIAHVLGIPLVSIPPRRSRGLRKLRENPTLRALGQELGLF